MAQRSEFFACRSARSGRRRSEATPQALPLTALLPSHLIFMHRRRVGNASDMYGCCFAAQKGKI